MSDNLDKKKADAKLISLTELYEVEYWTKKLNCKKSLLTALVKLFGHSVETIKDKLEALRREFPGVDDEKLAAALEACGFDFPCIHNKLGLAPIPRPRP